MKKCALCERDFEGYKSQKYCLECQKKRARKPRRLVKVDEVYENIRVDGMADRSYRYYQCHCLKCGNDFECEGSKVFIYAGTGCAICRKRASEEKKAEEIRAMAGKKFGNLEVLDCAGILPVYKSKTPIVKCRCLKCGEVTEIPLKRLKSGGARECVSCARKNLRAGHDIVRTASVDGTLITSIDGRRKTNTNNSSGATGVSWMPKYKKYRAYINFRRKQYHLGNYEKIEDAIAARKAAEKVLYGDFLKWYAESRPEEWKKLQDGRNADQQKSN